MTAPPSPSPLSALLSSTNLDCTNCPTPLAREKILRAKAQAAPDGVNEKLVSARVVGYLHLELYIRSTSHPRRSTLHGDYRRGRRIVRIPDTRNESDVVFVGGRPSVWRVCVRLHPCVA